MQPTQTSVSQGRPPQTPSDASSTLALGQRLGLEIVRQVEVELADGRVTVRPLALANAEMEGVRSPILVTLAEEAGVPLIGVTTLETLGFKVDPVAERLEPRTAIEY